jgi:hypothetical protein
VCSTNNNTDDCACVIVGDIFFFCFTSNYGAHQKPLGLVFKSSNQQQPTKPTFCMVQGSVSSRFLSHSSIKSGWEHVKQALYQISKVNIFSFFYLIVLLILDNTKCIQLQEE